MSSITIAQTEAAPGRKTGRDWLRAEFVQNRLVYGILVLFLLYTAGLALVMGEDLLPFIGYYLRGARRAIFVLASAFIVFVCIRSLLQREYESPFAYIREKALAPHVRHFAARFIFACLVLAVFMGGFLFNKTLIPILAPFSWDATFSRWDSLLLGGIQPWQVLHPLVAYPAMTMLLDYLYSAWVPLVFVFWAGTMAATGISRRLRIQYWLATMASWILIGLVMATLLSSAGPCFAPFIAPEIAAEYAPLNAYLGELGQGVTLTSAASKAYLWSIYAGGADLPGGISAMPSMHNAQAVLFAALAYRISRRFGHVMVAYAVVIFVGSIHLAWHYAVDGLVAAAAALAIWTACGQIVRIIDGRRALRPA